MRRWRGLPGSDGGFLPLLLALLIAAGGMISLGIITLNRMGGMLQKNRTVQEQLEKLEKSIRAESFRTLRLPCPALASGDGTAKTDCTGRNNDGVVPWRTLGLTRAAVTDPYGHLISYSVDPSLPAATDYHFCGGAVALPGSIRLQPGLQTSLLVLISHGPNGLGAWLPTGLQSPAPTSAPERENCADSATGRITCADPDPRRVTQGPYQDDPGARDFFDDTILAAVSDDYTPVCRASGGGGGGGT